MNRRVCFRASCRSSDAREVAGAVKFALLTRAPCDWLKYFSVSVLRGSLCCEMFQYLSVNNLRRAKLENFFLHPQVLLENSSKHVRSCGRVFTTDVVVAQETLECEFREANQFRTSTKRACNATQLFHHCPLSCLESWSNAKIFKCHNPIRYKFGHRSSQS